MNESIASRKAVFHMIHIRREWFLGSIILIALVAFEIFNFSTTEFALSDLLGDLSFFGISWATILAIAFCSIDFAGIARLFTPQIQSRRVSAVPTETWYLFGAWLLAATMNAMLTWWGVSMAVLNHQDLGNSVVSREVLLRGVPVFVALLVWLIRILVIGAFSVAGNRLFNQAEVEQLQGSRSQLRSTQSQSAPVTSANHPFPARPAVSALPSNHPIPKPASKQPEVVVGAQPEPTYHSLSAAAHSGSHTNRTYNEKPTMARTGNQIGRR